MANMLFERYSSSFSTSDLDRQIPCPCVFFYAPKDKYVVHLDQEHPQHNCPGDGKTRILQFNSGCPSPTISIQENSFKICSGIVTERLTSQYSIGPFTANVTVRVSNPTL